MDGGNRVDPLRFSGTHGPNVSISGPNRTQATGTYKYAHGQFIVDRPLVAGMSFNLEFHNKGILRLHGFESQDKAVRWMQSRRPLPALCQRIRSTGNLCYVLTVPPVGRAFLMPRDGERQPELHRLKCGPGAWLAFDIECGDVIISIFNDSPNGIMFDIGICSPHLDITANPLTSSANLKHYNPSALCSMSNVRLTPGALYMLSVKGMDNQSYLKVCVASHQDAQGEATDCYGQPGWPSISGERIIIKECPKKNYYLLVQDHGIVVKRSNGREHHQLLCTPTPNLTLWFELYKISFHVYQLSDEQAIPMGSHPTVNGSAPISVPHYPAPPPPRQRPQRRPATAAETGGGGGGAAAAVDLTYNTLTPGSSVNSGYNPYLDLVDDEYATVANPTYMNVAKQDTNGYEVMDTPLITGRTGPRRMDSEVTGSYVSANSGGFRNRTSVKQTQTTLDRCCTPPTMLDEEENDRHEHEPATKAGDSQDEYLDVVDGSCALPVSSSPKGKLANSGDGTVKQVGSNSRQKSVQKCTEWLRKSVVYPDEQTLCVFNAPESMHMPEETAERGPITENGLAKPRKKNSNSESKSNIESDASDSCGNFVSWSPNDIGVDPAFFSKIDDESESFCLSLEPDSYHHKLEIDFDQLEAKQDEAIRAILYPEDATHMNGEIHAVSEMDRGCDSKAMNDLSGQIYDDNRDKSSHCCKDSSSLTPTNPSFPVTPTNPSFPITVTTTAAQAQEVIVREADDQPGPPLKLAEPKDFQLRRNILPTAPKPTFKLYGSPKSPGSSYIDGSPRGRALSLRQDLSPNDKEAFFQQHGSSPRQGPMVTHCGSPGQLDTSFSSCGSPQARPPPITPRRIMNSKEPPFKQYGSSPQHKPSLTQNSQPKSQEQSNFEHYGSPTAQYPFQAYHGSPKAEGSSFRQFGSLNSKETAFTQHGSVQLQEQFVASYGCLNKKAPIADADDFKLSVSDLSRDPSSRATTPDLDVTVPEDETTKQDDSENVDADNKSHFGGVKNIISQFESIMEPPQETLAPPSPASMNNVNKPLSLSIPPQPLAVNADACDSDDEITRLKRKAVSSRSSSLQRSHSLRYNNHRTQLAAHSPPNGTPEKVAKENSMRNAQDRVSTGRSGDKARTLPKSSGEHNTALMSRFESSLSKLNSETPAFKSVLPRSRSTLPDTTRGRRALSEHRPAGCSLSFLRKKSSPRSLTMQSPNYSCQDGMEKKVHSNDSLDSRSLKTSGVQRDSFDDEITLLKAQYADDNDENQYDEEMRFKSRSHSDSVSNSDEVTCVKRVSGCDVTDSCCDDGGEVTFRDNSSRFRRNIVESSIQNNSEETIYVRSSPIVHLPPCEECKAEISRQASPTSGDKQQVCLCRCNTLEKNLNINEHVTRRNLREVKSKLKFHNKS